MPTYRWERRHDGDTSLSLENSSWVESWNVYNCPIPPGTPEWTILLPDMPELAPGQPHPIVAGAFVDRFGVKQLNNRSTAWIVEVTYGPLDDQRNTPPLERTPVVTMQHEEVTESTLAWEDGAPIINTAGYLITGVEKIVSYWNFHVEAWVSAVPAWSLSYANAVNSDAVSLRGLVVLAEYLRMSNLSVGRTDNERIGDVIYPFIPVNFDLRYNPNTWKTRVFNMGLYQLKDGEHIPCTDSNGEPASEPMFLKANGEQEDYPNPPDVSVNDFIAAIQSTVIEGWTYPRLPFNGTLPIA